MGLMQVAWQALESPQVLFRIRGIQAITGLLLKKGAVADRLQGFAQDLIKKMLSLINEHDIEGLLGSL
jgi:hypothetical protein